MTVWIVLYAIGAAQAAMLALALWQCAANPQANRVLAAWLAIVAVDLAIKSAHIAAPHAGLAGCFRFTKLLPLAYASLFYLYVRALTTGRGLRARDAVHATGFLLVLGWATWTVWRGGLVAMAGDGGPPPWFDPLQFAWAAIYLVAALLRVFRYRRQLRQVRSDADRMSLRWVVTMVACQLMVWTIALVHWQLRLPAIDYLLIYGAVAVWVCLVGWFSLAQPPVAPLPPRVPADDPLPEPLSVEDPRYPEVEARLEILMGREHLYREAALTVGALAKRSGYPEYLVSEVINRRLGGNFWEYVNRHRVEAVRCALADPGDARTILDIAYDAGFTSKSTFNASFKRIVGETPSAYRRLHGSSPARRTGDDA